MKTKQAVHALLVSLAALGFSACSDPKQEPAPETKAPDEVRTAENAIQRFTDGINWETRPDARATLYDELLNRNDAIGQLNAGTVHHSNEYEWFAFIDYEPGAYFRHPVAYTFVTYDKPRVSISAQKQLPTHNYTPIWSSVADLLADPNVFYQNSWLDREPARDSQAILAHTPLHWPPRMVADQCKNEKRAFALLIHNIEDLNINPETRDNLEMMAQALLANGYNLLEFKTSQTAAERHPYLNLSAPEGYGIMQLMKFINQHVDINDCCEEMVVYLTGETSLVKTGYTQTVTLDLTFPYSGLNRNRDARKAFFPEDLATILDQLKTCHLNVIVDTNNAAGFAGDLLRIPNTESVLVSCQENEYTYSSAIDTLAAGNFRDPFSKEDGERGSEFTSSVVKAFFEAAEGRTPGDVPTPAAELVRSGFEASKLYDLGYLGGKTNPHLEGRTLDSDCPCGIDTQLTKY